MRSGFPPTSGQIPPTSGFSDWLNLDPHKGYTRLAIGLTQDASTIIINISSVVHLQKIECNNDELMNFNGD